MSNKIEIENETENNINGKNNFDTNIKQTFKLEFNFDILNEPMPEFLQKKKDDNFFLNAKNYAYKRKYNEINSDCNYSYHGKAKPKMF